MLARGGARPDAALVRRMADALAHRGPDDAGTRDDPVCALSHRRLSIIDLEGGRQPLENEDGTIAVVFNGEIYNFPDLRRELLATGRHAFRTRSDTEVIVHGYEEWGLEGCLSRLSGMFAFALWDARRRTLSLARDRVGVKPLHWHDSGERLVFASELGALLQCPHVSRAIDPAALDAYLALQYVPSPLTIFAGVRKLEPAHYLVASPDRPGVLVRRYWDLAGAIGSDEDDLRSPPSEGEWVDRVEAAVSEAVRAHMLADVPVGAFLSGGVDSSTVVALMRRHASGKVGTYTIGFAERAWNEAPFARAVASALGTEHHEETLAPDVLDALPRLVPHYGEPFGDASCVPTWHVSRLARRDVKVVLSGDGGDEAFAGYRRFAAMLLLERCADWAPRALRAMLAVLFGAVVPEGALGSGIVRWLPAAAADRYADMMTVWRPEDRRALYADAVRGMLGLERGNGARGAALRAPGDYLRRCFHRPARGGTLARLQYLDTVAYLPEDVLTKVDRASMACSLEVRVPLLDHSLLELAARIPTRLRLRGTDTKRILKAVAARHVPREAFDRSKMGFGVPLSRWFRAERKDALRDRILTPSGICRQLFRERALEALLARATDPRYDVSHRLFVLLALAEWADWALPRDRAPELAKASTLA